MIPWFYLSFATDDEFLGGLYVEGADGEHALVTASILGLNPGGEVAMCGPLSITDMDANVLPTDRYRLLTKAQLGEAVRA